jgi:hypothetical protein
MSKKVDLLPSQEWQVQAADSREKILDRFDKLQAEWFEAVGGNPSGVRVDLCQILEDFYKVIYGHYPGSKADFRFYVE